jgi:hypothetical protein
MSSGYNLKVKKKLQQRMFKIHSNFEEIDYIYASELMELLRQVLYSFETADGISPSALYVCVWSVGLTLVQRARI